jgi:hypothetical protein
MISRKIIFFPVFGCIPENSLKNILRCLEQRKMKKKKKKKIQKPTQKCKPTTAIHHKKTHKPTITANPQTHHHSTSELESHCAAKPPRRVRFWGGINRRGVTQSSEAQ